jgi:tryptophan synthase beta chain
MGATDVERQAPNVFRMKLLGAEVMPVTSGAGTLKDAMNEALRDWVTNVDDTYYLIGTAAGPHPYPAMVRDLPVGDRQGNPRADAAARRPPARYALVAAVGGGSNAIGLFHPFLDDADDIKIVRRGSWRQGPGRRTSIAPRSPADRPACCTATVPTCCRMMTARCWKAIRSRPVSTIPASGLSIPG